MIVELPKNLEKLEASPYGNANCIATLLEFDHWPLLVLCNENDEYILDLFLDFDDCGFIDRSITFKISKQILVNYLNKEISFKQLLSETFSQDNFKGIINDYFDAEDKDEYFLIGKEFLDMFEYMPTEDSYFDLELSELSEIDLSKLVKQLEEEIRNINNKNEIDRIVEQGLIERLK